MIYMKFAILTDIHLGLEGYYEGVLRKINRDARKFINSFIKEMNDTVKPDFVVVLGDLIEDDNRERDMENISYVADRLTELKCPVYYVAGNHDLKNISEKKLRELLKLESLYYSFDYDNFHFIVLYSKTVEEDKIRIPENERFWLINDLEESDKNCIVFVHHSLADQDLEGNPWFEGRPKHCLVGNRNQVRNILEESGEVMAVFNSHLHWDRKDIHNGIPYFTIQSLVENEEDRGIASEAYAVVNLEDGDIQVEVKGNYSKKFSHVK